MKISIAADHAGLALKEQLRDYLAAAGHEVQDLGTHTPESTDYPDYASAVCREVTAGHADRGVLVCFTGVGMSMAANKVRGIRAALGVNVDEVQLTRAHNDANVLTLGAKYTGTEAARELVDAFLSTPFDGGERHSRRVSKIAQIEQQQGEEP